ncbi:hypothetical protein ACFOLJ_24735 [Rugamonas sp. CCM 8940]|uniref:hypothetical protein n=1 Tax=Rugamonas sp. CCM 8940 TaxID=2765359 RepID=UPI0018F28731|nr:hypothetical protein [Rugamonas sp. CCM 8940]MBJ7313187.1 hypothetical protein [Rugamonas sp. CCM 8940]
MNKILTLEEIESGWGKGFSANEKVTFEVQDVPENLRPLIPYALLWGISDDWFREDALKRTPSNLKENLKWVVGEFDDQLDAWLAGAEAACLSPSNAYIAFSAMRMGVDFI